MLIDTHAHLNFKAFKSDLDQVIQRAKKAGVEKIIVVGSDLKSSKKAIDLAQKYESLYASIGIHPHHVNSLNSDTLEYRSNLVKNLTALAKNKKVVAIGETGLDYHQYTKSKYQDTRITKKIKDLQEALFKLHLDLAKKLNLPLIIHCREALDGLLSLLVPEANNLKRKGAFHCFEGNKNHLDQALKLGFCIGFNGLITYPEKESLRNLVKKTPIERLLLETDSPFLTPEPLRGTKNKLASLVFRSRNEPKNIKIITKAVAALKNISMKEVEEKATGTSYSLFKFP